VKTVISAPLALRSQPSLTLFHDYGSAVGITLAFSTFELVSARHEPYSGDRELL